MMNELITFVCGYFLGVATIFILASLRAMHRPKVKCKDWEGMKWRMRK